MGEATNATAVETFIRRNELIAVLGLLKPDPAAATHEHNDYVFERSVKKHKDKGDSQGRIDLYKKNSFVLEAKQSRLKGVKKVADQNDLFTAEIPEDSRGRRGANRAWDVLMLNAKRQAEEYARALPTSHGWPPFILVCDVGHCIEVYADFSGQGKNYTQFPDRQTFRIYLEDLRNEEVCERLRKIWLDPASLDPAQASAKVTRDIAIVAWASIHCESTLHGQLRTSMWRALYATFFHRYFPILATGSSRSSGKPSSKATTIVVGVSARILQ